MTTGQIYRANASNQGAWSTATYPDTASTSGNVLTSDGTNWTSAATSAFTPVNWSVKLSANQANVTGNGTAYKIPYDTVVFDSNSAYDTGTKIYTVPTTGKYQIIINDYIYGGSIASTIFLSWLSINGAGFGPNRINNMNPSASLSIGTEFEMSNSVLLSLTAGDTIEYFIEVRNTGSDNVGVNGGTVSANFNGFRIS
jgi:hypothetical protein